MFALESNPMTADMKSLRSSASAPRSALLHDMALMLGRQFTVYTAARQAATAAQLGLPLADCRALELLIEFEALPTGQLAGLMGLSSGGTTALINRLEAGGYVQRGRHPLDRRMIVISPVPERCRPLEAMMRDIAIEIGLHTQRYDDEQMEAAHAILARCVRAFRHDTLRWLESRSEERTGA